MRIVLDLNSKYGITENFETINLLPNEIYPDNYMIKEQVDKIKEEILETKIQKNISFFLALKDNLHKIKEQFNDAKVRIEDNRGLKIVINLRDVDIDNFFVFKIYTCSGSEQNVYTDSYGIHINGLKIEFIDDQINIEKIIG